MGMLNYIKAAFGARPRGMFVAPNWVFLGGVALGGLLNPGIWLLGAGLELLYLLGLASNRRFQRYVDGRQMLSAQQQWQQKRSSLLAQLTSDDRDEYLLLEQRCRSIIEQQRKTGGAGEADLAAQQEGLARMAWIYMRMLLTREAIRRVLKEAGAERSELDSRINRIQRQLKDEQIGVELRRSLEGQLEILQKRVENQQAARENLDFIESELSRIREQVELIKEQAVLSSDPSMLSTRIDEVGASLSGTTQWMRDKQAVFGRLDALMDEPPGAAMQTE